MALASACACCAALLLAGRRWGEDGTFSTLWTDASGSRADGAVEPRMVPEQPIIATWANFAIAKAKYTILCKFRRRNGSGARENEVRIAVDSRGIPSCRRQITATKSSCVRALGRPGHLCKPAALAHFPLPQRCNLRRFRCGTPYSGRHIAGMHRHHLG